MLDTDGGLVPGLLHNLHVFPLLFVVNKSYPFEDVVELDVHNVFEWVLISLFTLPEQVMKCVKLNSCPVLV